MDCVNRPEIIACLMLWIASMIGCGAAAGDPASDASRVTVLVASSTADAIKAIAEQFEQEHAPYRVELSAGSSNRLAQQVRSEAPGDLFLSANQNWTDAVTEEGLVLETAPLLINRMVLVVPTGNPAGVKTASDLTSDRVSRIAIAGDQVPAGIYAEQALRSLDLFTTLRDGQKIARGANVRITLAYVERAEADAGIVYETDAQISEDVEVVDTFDPTSHDPVIYPVSLLAASQDRAAPRRFFEYLLSSQAQTVFQKYGFTRAPAKPPTE